MTFQSAPDCAEAVIEATVGFSAIANVLNFLHVGGYNSVDLANLADAVDNRVGASYKALMSSAVDYTRTHVRGLAALNDFEDANATNTGIGTAAGASMPANAAFCCTLVSANTGRSARGRFYAFPTGDGNKADAMSYTVGYSNAVAAMLNQLRLDAAGVGWTMVVLSRFTNKAPRLTAVTFPVTLAVARNTLIDSQRGRLVSGH